LVPKTISANILAFCHDINPAMVPQYVCARSVVAIPKSGFSVEQVKHVMENEGGELVLGWVIWEWPNVVLEAEPYAVWRKDGYLYDVTPRRGGKVLFLEDPSIVSNEPYPLNKMRALRNDAAIDKYIECAQMFVALRLNYDSSKGPDGQSEEFQQKLEQVFKKMRRAKNRLIKQNPVANLDRPCHCESGRSYRDCCALSILPSK
jgi:hypothetical protein